MIIILVYTLDFPVLSGQKKNNPYTKFTLSDQLEYVSFTIDRDFYLSGEPIMVLCKVPFGIK